MQYIITQIACLLLTEIIFLTRDAASSKNTWEPVVIGRATSAPLVQIGLTDLQKTAGAIAPPTPPTPASLLTSAQCRKCDQTITGRNFLYKRALEIVQNEEYLDESDFDEIRYKQKKRLYYTIT